jgi:tRNA modification GTPase
LGSIPVAILRVTTKADLEASPLPRFPASALRTSAVTGEGLDALKAAIVHLAFGERASLPDLEPGLTRERHRIALTRAQEALREAVPHLSQRGDAVLAAHHLRDAARALEELIGVVDVDEVLDRVFRSFCVGK